MTSEPATTHDRWREATTGRALVWTLLAFVLAMVVPTTMLPAPQGDGAFDVGAALFRADSTTPLSGVALVSLENLDDLEDDDDDDDDGDRTHRPVVVSMPKPEAGRIWRCDPVDSRAAARLRAPPARGPPTA